MISIITPAYNSELYLAEAVRSAAAQTYGDTELIIIDDCSTDSTPLLARDLCARYGFVRAYRTNGNLGAAGARNLGAGLARGDFIAYLDADDAWIPDKLERQLALLRETGADLCYTGYSFMDGEGRPIRRPYCVPEAAAYEGLLRENPIGLSTVLIRRGSMAGIRMRPDFAHEDYAFWLELLKGGRRAVGIPAPLARYRITKGSRSHNKRQAAAGRWDIYRRLLGLPPARCARYFAGYASHGIIKHYVN